MLENVVEKGTGKAVHSDVVRIAGKTGTAQIAQGGVYRVAGHQVAFCGYFPAENPQYTCIVVIRQPSIGYPSGGTMSGAVVKNIAEKIYSNFMPYDVNTMARDSAAVIFPLPKAGNRSALEAVLAQLKVGIGLDSLRSGWVMGERVEARDSVRLKDLDFRKDLVPNVVGMGAKDAVYIMEKVGLRVSMERNSLALKGVHNLYNSFAAGIAAKLVDIQDEKIRASLSDFTGVEHRLEKVARVKGVDYVNDSKATNVNSCTGLQVEVVDSLDKHFVSKGDLVSILKNAELYPVHKPIGAINTERIERELLKNEMIARVEVYKTPSRLIKLEVEQKIPIIRIISNSDNYYIDNRGTVMPISPHYVADVPIASGNVEKTLAKTDLYKFALFLQKNKFWNDQIEQIYIYPDNEVDLIPRVGDHRIILGDFTDFEAKLNKLQLFYEQAMVGTVFVYSPALLLADLTPQSLDVMFWIVVVFAYYVLATMLPIDKIIGKIYPLFAFALLFMAVGLMAMLYVHHPAIPELWDGLQNRHPDASQPIFPCLFITIACGAISGFHGTQSPLMARCLKDERHGIASLIRKA